MFGMNVRQVQAPLYHPFPRGRRSHTIHTTFGSMGGLDVLTPDVVSRKIYPGVNGAISITSGTGTYSINGGTFVSTAGTVVDTDYVEARQDSSASYSTPLELVFSIAGVPDTYTVTTIANPAVYAPDPDGNDMTDPDGNPVEEF